MAIEKIECAHKRGHTDRDTLQNTMPPNCKAKGCKGDFVKKDDFCHSFDPVERDGKNMCAWKLGMHKDEPIAETIMRLCERLKCNGVFEKRPECADFADDEINENMDLLRIVEKKE